MNYSNQLLKSVLGLMYYVLVLLCMHCVWIAKSSCLYLSHFVALLAYARADLLCVECVRLLYSVC